MVQKSRARSGPSDNKLCDYKRWMEEDDDDKMDADYKLRDLTKGESFESRKKGRERDDYVYERENEYVDDDTDPDFENVLRCLKECGNSYILEDENDGLITIVKYEEDTSSERERDPEPRRKLRSASKREYGLSDQRNGVEIKNKNRPKLNSDKNTRSLTGRKSKEQQAKSKKAEEEDINGRESDENGPDPDYYNFIRNCKIVNGKLVYKYQGYEIVYDKNDEVSDQKKKVKHDDDDDSDGSSSDLEIIDCISLYKKGNSNSSQMNKDSSHGVAPLGVDYRHQVIANLKKPYDQEEYDMLWKDISFCKPKLHHKELRNGRELSYLTDTEGKSYLQHYPEFKRQFDRYHDDKPKRLNLLRGFFFWLKNKVHDGSFKPWKDAECLSLNPAGSSC